MHGPAYPETICMGAGSQLQPTRRSTRKRTKNASKSSLRVKKSANRSASAALTRPEFLKTYRQPPLDKALESGQGSLSLGSSRQSDWPTPQWAAGEKLSLAENLKLALTSTNPDHVLRNALCLDNAFSKKYTSLSQKLDKEYPESHPIQMSSTFQKKRQPIDSSNLALPAPNASRVDVPRELLGDGLDWIGERFVPQERFDQEEEMQISCQPMDSALCLPRTMEEMCAPMTETDIMATQMHTQMQFASDIGTQMMIDPAFVIGHRYLSTPPDMLPSVQPQRPAYPAESTWPAAGHYSETHLGVRPDLGFGLHAAADSIHSMARDSEFSLYG